jgi:adenylate cyclase
VSEAPTGEEVAASQLLASEQVAESAGVGIDDLTSFIEAGVIIPDEKGMFRRGDIARVRLVSSLISSGISLEALSQAVEESRLSFDYVDRLMPEPVALVQPSEDDADALRWGPDLEPILGTSRSRDGLVRSDDLRILHMMSRAVEMGIPPERVVRIARSFAQVASRLVDMQREFVDEVLLGPAIEETGSPIEALEKTAKTRYEYRRLGRALLFELMDRQVDDAVFRNLVQLTEFALAEGGVDLSRATEGVAFIDIGEYSLLSETHGDDVAAIQASRLADLVQDVARRRRGRLVKSLGDGALVHAEAPDQVLQLTLDVVGMAEEQDIWPLHAGVNVGRVVQRDGDLFGSAVNIASRIAEKAKPGEVVVSRSVVQAVEPMEGVVFEAAGEAQLKNISVPVELFRARRSRMD